ncbi:sulfide/dihydroorotate dehydrogenase-like FAD/NAD-binding protein [candidate division WOR-3 bacterium]|nr:sulfide/dihydroorotate dehydrogenase-like FAD/NAD-binding protein [candidate division WOR-3 bacterium]
MKYNITQKKDIGGTDYLLEVEAPQVAERIRPGNFVVLITVPNGERIPMSVQKAEDGKIAMFVKKLGKTSRALDACGECTTLEAVVGPMGKPVELKKFGNVVFVSDLVCGHAENYLFSQVFSKIEGNHMISMQTFPTKDEIYPEEYLAKGLCDEYYLTTKDGSVGLKGHYLEKLKELLDEGRCDIIFGGGDIPSLHELAKLTRPYEVPTIVTVRQIMVDATGMCGSCRVFVSGEMKLSCIDGPMFDATKLDFEDIISRLGMFKEAEAKAMEWCKQQQECK